MLYYTNTRKYCGKDANLQINVVLCLSTWIGRCSPGLCSHWAKAWPGGNLRASEANMNTSGGADNPLTIFVKKQQGMKDWRKIWSWLALMHTTSLSRLDVGEWGIMQTMKKNWWHDFPSSVVFVNSNHVHLFFIMRETKCQIRLIYKGIAKENKIVWEWMIAPDQTVILGL